MKHSAKNSWRLLMLMSALMLASLSSCRKHSESPAFNPEMAAINDTLRSGNVAEAMRMTENLKRASLSKSDSATWSDAMVQQGVNAYYQGNAPLVLASSDSALRWLTRQKVTPALARTLAKAYQTRGAYYDQFHFNADSNIYYLRKAVDNMELSGIGTELPQAYGNYANALRMGAALDSAAVYYHRAISAADSLGLEPVHYIPLYNGIASVFTDMRDFSNSAIWWGKSMEIFGSMNQFDKFNTLTGYGNDFYYRDDFDGALKIFTRLRAMLDSIPGAEWETMFTDVNLADSYIRTGRIGEAMRKLDAAAEYFSKEQPNPMVTSYIHTLLMRAATSQGRYEDGLNLANRYPESDTLRLEQHLARLKAMEDLYANIGNYRQAYLTRGRYDHLNDSLRSYKQNQLISAINATYQRDQRILNLEAANTEQQASIYKLTAAIAIAVAVIVGLILFFVVRRANLKRREERMMLKIISLRQENLRNRITPHFIYNALNHELLNEKRGKPSHLNALVGLIRQQQIIASEMLIPFSEELRFTDDYIQVMSDNGRGPFAYSCHIQPGIDTDFLFPSMTLQILVENAFKHGFTTLEPETERKLKISVDRVPDGRIAVRVFNNCGESPSGMEKGGTGLRVLLETIRIINEHNRRQTQFRMDSDAELDGLKGYNATITLPDDLKP